jgi:voltage-gated potassium channel
MPSKVHPVTEAEVEEAAVDDPGIDVYLAQQFVKWRVWMSKGPVFYMDIANALLSLVSCFDFVISTYNVVDNAAIDTVENVLLIVFVLDYLLRIAISEYPATYITSTTALVDLSTIIPGIVEIGIGSNSGGVSLGFLRVIRVLRVLKLLRLQRLASASSLLYQQYVLITVTIFTIMFISAGIMQVLDGQIPKLTILPYFDYLYMNVVLLSTVGYGDIVPITPQNKLFVLVLLGAAGSVVSVQVRNISQYIVFRNTFRDSKYLLTSRPHIVISGDHPSELAIFLSEFFHPDHGDNMTDVVIFSYHPPDPSIIPKIGLQTQGNLIEFVQIQPGEYTELSRTRADRANAVFILNSSATHEEPRELDNRVSLYMVLVKQYVARRYFTRSCSLCIRFLKSNSALDVPVHAQLILKESVQALRSMMQYDSPTPQCIFVALCLRALPPAYFCDIPPRYMFGAMPYDFVSCSDDLRLCLAGRSLKCPGFNFVFNSLMRSFSDLSVADAHEKIHSMPDWMAQSMQSCTQEMYHVKATPDMTGSSFTHLALCSMYMSPSLIFGVVTIQGQSQSFRPNPMDLCLGEDHILAIFAADQDSANALVAQLSMVLTKLSEAADADAALLSIQAAEGTNSFLRSNNHNLSEFTLLLREMQHNLHRGHHSSLSSPPRSTSPDVSDRASLDKKRKPLSELASIEASHDRPRLGRSNTFVSAIGDSFLPNSRRNTQLSPLEETAQSPSLHAAPSPLSRLNSATSHGGSPLLRATLGRAADALNPFSASSHRLTKNSARDRRDSDSSAGVSSVSLTSDSQVSAAAFFFFEFPMFILCRLSESFGLNSWPGLGS